MTGTLGATTYQPEAVVNNELTGLSINAVCVADPNGNLLTFNGSGQIPVYGSVNTSPPTPAVLFSESASARTSSGNSGNLTPTGYPTGMILAYNITAVSGVLPTLVVALQQQDANGVFQTVGSTASLSTTGSGTLSVGPGLSNSVMVSGNNITRIAWTIGGTTPSFTVQFSLITR